LFFKSFAEEPGEQAMEAEQPPEEGAAQTDWLFSLAEVLDNLRKFCILFYPIDSIFCC